MTSDPKATGVADGRRSIQSVETGFPLLAALVKAGTPLTLGDLASRAGMSSAKAHPYLVSFTRVGLVQQDHVSGQYELGPFALQLGLASLRRLDPVRTALPEVNRLAGVIGHTLAIAVLGSHGPTMVHICQANYPVHVNMRHGTVMSMLHTATGNVFIGWLPPAIARHYIDRESGDFAVVTSPGSTAPRDEPALRALADRIRRAGLALALGNPLPGIDAVSVPVFDHNGDLAMALTSLGPSSLFDARPDGRIATALLECAGAISMRLGHQA